MLGGPVQIPFLPAAKSISRNCLHPREPPTLHQLNAREFERTPETVKDREVWGAAVHGLAESNTTELLNPTEESTRPNNTPPGGYWE